MFLTVWDAPVYFTVLVAANAVSVLINEVPPRSKVEPAACVNPPDPLRSVATVRLLLLVNVIVLTVILGIVNEPFSACAFVSKVWIPVPAV